jgi:NADPH2:quinone reductase
VDVVLESVGGDVLARSVDAEGVGGGLVTVGKASPAPSAPGDIGQLFSKRLSLYGVYMGAYEGRAEALTEIVDLVAAGKLEAVIDRSFPLSQAAEAHRYVAARKNLGKVLLIP